LLKELPKIYHKHIDDEQAVVEYAEQIHSKRMWDETMNWMPLDLEQTQTPSFSQYRQILIDFMTYFHMVCKIKDDNTLFLSVQFLDRYLSKVQVPNKKLQLFGCACMLLAEKYEEIYPNPNKVYVKLSAESFTKAQLQAAERRVGKELNFRFEIIPTSYEWFMRFVWLLKLNQNEVNFANMILHILMYNHAMLKIKPSLHAIASIILAQKFTDEKECDLSTYDYRIVRQCLREQCCTEGTLP
jgi:hypothetical protein